MSGGKGKGKPHWRIRYYADEGYWNEEPSYEHDSYHYDSYQDDAYGGSYVGLFASDEQPDEDAPQEFAEEEVEEWEATALNALKGQQKRKEQRKRANFWGSLTLDPKNPIPSGIVGSNSPRPPVGSR